MTMGIATNFRCLQGARAVRSAGFDLTTGSLCADGEGPDNLAPMLSVGGSVLSKNQLEAGEGAELGTRLITSK